MFVRVRILSCWTARSQTHIRNKRQTLHPPPPLPPCSPTVYTVQQRVLYSLRGKEHYSGCTCPRKQIFCTVFELLGLFFIIWDVRIATPLRFVESRISFFFIPFSSSPPAFCSSRRIISTHTSALSAPSTIPLQCLSSDRTRAASITAVLPTHDCWHDQYASAAAAAAAPLQTFRFFQEASVQRRTLDLHRHLQILRECYLVIFSWTDIKTSRRRHLLVFFCGEAVLKFVGAKKKAIWENTRRGKQSGHSVVRERFKKLASGFWGGRSSRRLWS